MWFVFFTIKYEVVYQKNRALEVNPVWFTPCALFFFNAFSYIFATGEISALSSPSEKRPSCNSLFSMKLNQCL